MSKHTPGDLHGMHLDFYDGNDQEIGTVYPYSDGRHNANLKRIVMCWNTHDELVAQLKKATYALNAAHVDYGQPDSEYNRVESVIEECSALIKKIEEM